jgi:hypothetical protein
MADDEALRTLLKHLHQRPIAYYPVYADLMGSVAGGVILSQVMFHWGSNGQERFPMHDRDLRAETHATIRELRAAKITFKSLPFLTVSLEGLPATTWYDVHVTELAEALSVQTSLNDVVQTGCNDVVPTGCNDVVQTFIKRDLKRDFKTDTPTARGVAVQTDTEHVLGYLNTVHAREFTRATQITKLLTTGIAVEACLLVIDWLWEVKRIEDPDGYERFMNPTSQFRPDQFERNLDRARRWDQQGRPSCLPPGVVADKNKKTVDAIDFLKERRRTTNGEHRPKLRQLSGKLGENEHPV